MEVKRMRKTVRGRYHAGKIEPLEPLELEEGAEVDITVTYDAPPTESGESTTATFGAWKDLLDCEEFEKDVYESRLIQTRPEVQL
jgi:predicted DNA-binding antitoxin AbrB/MazE fold protein